MGRLVTLLFISFALLLSLYGCGDDAPSLGPATQETIQLEPYKDACAPHSTELCLVGKHADDEQPRVVRKTIAGFNFAWGRRQTVRVLTRAGQYSLTQVLDQEQESADRAFQMTLNAQSVQSLGQCVFAIANEVKFSVSSARLCRELESFKAAGGERVFEFSYSSSSAVPIQLESLGAAEGEHRE